MTVAGPLRTAEADRSSAEGERAAAEPERAAAEPERRETLSSGLQSVRVMELVRGPRDVSVANTMFSVVPHTHWDREWYLPFQVFRMKLVRTVDQILDVLESDSAFRHFTLDGQVSIVEDYLEVRPQHAERLTALVEAGRLSIGPSYVLPDEFLASQEALVRNLLVGREVASRFGGAMQVGYMPDPFGHVAQLPQILVGFGLEAFVFWRGLGDEADTLPAFFRWSAPDGSTVLAIRQLGSYGNADELGRWQGDGKPGLHDEPERWQEAASGRFARFIRQFGEPLSRSPISAALLCNGSDHRPIQPDLPALIAGARLAAPELQVRISSYAEHAERLRPWADEVPAWSGELLGAREAHLLRGINSARIALKQAAETTERALLVAETCASLATLGRGAAYPLAELRTAWRLLLQNLPHDSISGCSVDAVHRDMQWRFAGATQIAHRVRDESLAALAGVRLRFDLVRTAQAEAGVVNPLPWRRIRAVDLPIPEELRKLPLAARMGSRLLPVQLIGKGDAATARTAIRVDGFSAVPLTLVVAAAADGGAGEVASLPAGIVAAVPSGEAATIENGFYRVTLSPDGAATVTDLRSGTVHAGVNTIEDVGDRGDEYTFGAVAGDVAWTSTGSAGTVRLADAGPITATLEARFVAKLPARLAPSRSRRSATSVACPVRVRVSLTAGEDRVAFRTTIDNRASDHRLRVLFPVPDGDSAEIRAEGHFAVLRRPARPISAGIGWAEAPAVTHHTSGFITAGSLTVIGRGLPEYEAMPVPEGGVTLALTLLRCVGFLSRDDIESRPGHAGPEIATPEAQCQGISHFEYAVTATRGRTDAELVNASADYRFGFEVGPPAITAAAPLLVSGEGISFAALKGAEDGDGVVLRLYNPGQCETAIDVTAPHAGIRAIRLDESALEGAEQSAVGWSDVLPGGRIQSLRLTASARESA